MQLVGLAKYTKITLTTCTSATWQRTPSAAPLPLQLLLLLPCGCSPSAQTGQLGQDLHLLPGPLAHSPGQGLPTHPLSLHGGHYQRFSGSWYSPHQLQNGLSHPHPQKTWPGPRRSPQPPADLRPSLPK